MKATCTIDARGFQSMVADLQRYAQRPGGTGSSIPVVLRGETGKVLEKAVRWTGAAKASAKPRKALTSGGTGFAREGDSELWVNTTGKGGSPIGRVWLHEPNADGLMRNYIIRGPGELRHWSNDRWQRSQRMLEKADISKSESRASKKKRDKITGRGLAKRSWVQIADDLHIPMRVPAYVRKAIPQDGKERKSGAGREFNSTRSIFFEIENRYPILLGSAQKMLPGFDGAGILQRAVTTQITGFTIAVKKGVFEDVKARAQRYPGIFVKPS